MVEFGDELCDELVVPFDCTMQCIGGLLYLYVCLFYVIHVMDLCGFEVRNDEDGYRHRHVKGKTIRPADI